MSLIVSFALVLFVGVPTGVCSSALLLFVGEAGVVGGMLDCACALRCVSRVGVAAVRSWSSVSAVLSSVGVCVCCACGGSGVF